MASVAGLSLSEAIIPLKQSFETENLRTTKVEHRWITNAGGPNQREHSSKMYLPVCDDPSNKELFLYVIDQFLDAADTVRLHLTTGDSRYNKFRQVLDGSLRLDWQNLSTARANKSLDTFIEDVHALIMLYFPSSSRMDQFAYLTKATKPFNMTVNEVSARLTVIGRLGRLLPGSWTAANHAQMNPIFSTTDGDLEKKRTLFHIMPMAWRIKFAETAHRLDDANYTYANLTQYMALQESIEKNARGLKRRRGDTPGGRGYGGRGRASGRGRGESAYGRGYGGRGYGGRGRGYGRGYGRGSGGTYGGYPGSPTHPRTPNPYMASAGGGRFQSPRTPGSQAQGSGGFPYRRISHSPPGRGRGRGPQIPNFMAEDHYYQGQDSRAHAQHPTMHEQGGDQYYQDDQYYQGQDQYYQGEDQYYHGDSYQEQEQYYQEQGQEDQYMAQEDQHFDPNDAYYHVPDDGAQDHFLHDFGY